MCVTYLKQLVCKNRDKRFNTGITATLQHCIRETWHTVSQDNIRSRIENTFSESN
jgi:hypothetical protein